MANITRGNNENIYQLLSKYNFTLINKSSDDYKCVICQRILINAHQAFCGCNYCKKCVDEQVINGVIFCPGDTEECKTATLSNVFIDQKTNKQISQLVVKCPEELCCYESQLKEMGDHLRLCGTKSVECPFTDLGCHQGKLKMDELNEHLQQENCRHSEILIDMIGNLRNELSDLKRNRDKCDEAIDKLAKSDREKDAIIESMRNLMELMKREKAALEQRLDHLSNLLRSKVAEMIAEFEAKLEDLRQELRVAIEQRRLAEANAQERNEAVEEYVAEDGDSDFVWTIDNIAEKRQRRECVDSEYFNGYSEPYKMRLLCYIGYDEIQIHFLIDRDDSDDSLQWPFGKDVTIGITNPMRPNVTKSITKHCTIGKPSFLTICYPMNDPFAFQWTELFNEGLVRGNRLAVRCSVSDP